MGRSISTVAPSILRKLNLPAAYYDPRLNRHYEVYTQSGNLYQSQFQLNGEGKEVFRDTHRIQWIVGAGANVFGAIIQRGDYLFEAPLAFYTKPMTWGLGPGYEFTDLGFNRPILAGCMACHSGRSTPVPATNGRYEKVVFPEMTIGCERCHGPGAAHVQAIMSGASLHKKDLHIVNPAHLTPTLANNICMSCHEIADARVLKPGKSFQDFRPGTPLDDTFSVLMVPPSRKSPPQEDHLQQYYSMTLSKCYRATGGRLRCITCHDPHVEPSRQEAPAYFNSKCLTCHTNQSCSLPLETRQRTRPPDNCIGCHMPKRAVQVIAHSSLTNHRILARSDEAFPDSAFHQTTPALPNLIHLNPAPGKGGVAPPLLTLLQAYGELAGYKPEYVAPYLKVLDQLRRTQPASELVQACLGRKDLISGRTQEAIDHLRYALRIGPPQATVYGDLSDALDKLGRRQEALVMLQKGIDQDPFNPVLQMTLVRRLIELKQYSNAQAALKHYLQIFPQDSSMRQMLGRIK
ncbi:MAG: tetratricopeptide repeat protein [Acidobacteriaceae bacterium]